MKTADLQNTASAFAGRMLLCCYRLYIFLFKETNVYVPADTIPGKGHTRFTSNQFKAPCYN